MALMVGSAFTRKSVLKDWPLTSQQADPRLWETAIKESGG